MKISEVAEEALSFARSKIGTADQRRIAAILELLGWHRLKKDHQGILGSMNHGARRATAHFSIFFFQKKWKPIWRMRRLRRIGR